MTKQEAWTKDKSVESLLRVIETGKTSEMLAAIKLLNAMYGFNEPEDDTNESELEGKIEIVLVKPEQNNKL